MREVERIAAQMRAAMDGPAWHGPSVVEALEGVDVKRAVARPIPDGHSIAEITHHIAGWIDVVRRRIEGETVSGPEGGDFPEGSLTDESWRQTLDRLRAAHEALLATTERLEDAGLDRQLGSGRPTVYVLLHGAVQHNLYHAGQIGLLKKA
jgi:uncharacterized damage-inducible protein DinB